ncbi:MAG TPA: hypothetical protein VGH37_16055 [Candidatus Acidoferrum sp.]|jgi:hypothetical protein
MRNAIVALALLVCFVVPAGNASSQVTDSRNLMWCNARSGKTFYYSAWFRYTESRMAEHRAKFQKDTQTNYGLKTLDTPTCYSFPEPGSAADALEANVKSQKKAGFQIVTTGWMPQ